MIFVIMKRTEEMNIKRKMLLSMLALLLVAALSVTTSVTAGEKIESKKVSW